MPPGLSGESFEVAVERSIVTLHRHAKQQSKPATLPIIDQPSIDRLIAAPAAKLSAS